MGVAVNNQAWIPKFLCYSFYVSLNRWKQNNKKTIKFETPMKWRRPRLDHLNCYFCLYNITGINVKANQKLVYTEVDSITPPILIKIDKQVAYRILLKEWV